MDTKQLEIIVQLISKLGDQTTVAFIWYIVLDKLLPVLGWCFAVCGVCYIGRLIYHYNVKELEKSRR